MELLLLLLLLVALISTADPSPPPPCTTTSPPSNHLLPSPSTTTSPSLIALPPPYPTLPPHWHRHQPHPHYPAKHFHHRQNHHAKHYPQNHHAKYYHQNHHAKYYLQNHHAKYYHQNHHAKHYPQNHHAKYYHQYHQHPPPITFTTTIPPPPQSPVPPSTTITPPPQSPLPPSPATSPPPPTMQPPQPEFKELQLHNIIDALMGSGDFGGWAYFLSTAKQLLLPVTATLFIPRDDSLTDDLPQVTAAGVSLDPFLVAYHIIPQHLTFSDLQKFPVNTRVPTLLSSYFIVITNISSSNFTVDDSVVTHPDMYTTRAFTVHGVSKILDYKAYGGVNITFTQDGEGNSTHQALSPVHDGSHHLGPSPSGAPFS